MKYTPRLPKSNVNVTPTSMLREFFVLTLSLAAIIVTVYLLLGFAVDLIVPRISTDLETKMSELFIRSLDAEDVDSKWGGYVQSLVEDLQKRCTKLPYPFKVHVRKTSSINALALPGGHIIVFTELLDKITSENELAFVFAHEMGHYANRDHLRGVGRAFVFITISTFLFGTDSNISQMMAHALNITELSFSRKQEALADEFALELLNCAYGNVAGATDFFGKIPKEQDPGKIGHYFASHPENLKRIRSLRKIIRDKGFTLAGKKPLPETLKPLKD
jgi:Zn-dependent protease with chaperone function